MEVGKASSREGLVAESFRRVDPVHRNRLEGGDVDSAVVKNCLDPLRGPADAAPGAFGAVRGAVH